MSTSIGAALRAAFLRGETVFSMEFAATHGFTRQGVGDSLKWMRKRGMVTSVEQKREGRGRAAIAWTCADLAVMEAYQPKEQTQNLMLGRCKPRGEFAALLNVWGIRTVHLDVPSHRHGSWA